MWIQNGWEMAQMKAAVVSPEAVCLSLWVWRIIVEGHSAVHLSEAQEGVGEERSGKKEEEKHFWVPKEIFFLGSW